MKITTQQKADGSTVTSFAQPTLGGALHQDWEGWSPHRTIGYQPPPPVGVIEVVDESGDVLCRETITNKEFWGRLTAHYPEVEGRAVVPATNCKLTEEALRFTACTYDASADFAASILGIKLHLDDKDWLAGHQFATDGGIPMEYTATCLHGLFEPYGFGVSRIRFRAGTLQAGEEAQRWMRYLGCNPVGSLDRSTPNRAAAEQLGVPPETFDRCRVEFAAEPLRPSIIGEQGWSSGNGVVVGAQGGHARYLSPRGRAGNWLVSVQIARLSEIDYLETPTLPEYKRRRGKLSLDRNSITAPDGTAIPQYETSYGGHTPAHNGSFALPPSKGALINPGVFQCTHCKTYKSAEAFVCLDADLCSECLARFWSSGDGTGYRCPGCKTPFTMTSSPSYVGPNPQDEPEFACPTEKCSRRILLPDTPVGRVIQSYFEYRPVSRR